MKKRNPKLNRQRGKAFERYVAKELKGERRGVLGGADVVTAKDAIECKSRESMAITGWFKQAERNAEALGKLPKLALHIHGQRHDKDLY